LARISQGLAALRDFGPAYDRLGSKAALIIEVGRSGMSGMPPKADMRQSRRQLFANAIIAVLPRSHGSACDSHDARRPASIATGYIDHFVMVITDRLAK
jgi:hypothetical protein